jgi:hypothetical protein
MTSRSRRPSREGGMRLPEVSKIDEQILMVDQNMRHHLADRKNHQEAILFPQTR